MLLILEIIEEKQAEKPAESQDDNAWLFGTKTSNELQVSANHSAKQARTFSVKQLKFNACGQQYYLIGGRKKILLEEGDQLLCNQQAFIVRFEESAELVTGTDSIAEHYRSSLFSEPSDLSISEVVSYADKQNNEVMDNKINHYFEPVANTNNTQARTWVQEQNRVESCARQQEKQYDILTELKIDSLAVQMPNEKHDASEVKREHEFFSQHFSLDELNGNILRDLGFLDKPSSSESPHIVPHMADGSGKKTTSDIHLEQTFEDNHRQKKASRGLLKYFLKRSNHLGEKA